MITCRRARSSRAADHDQAGDLFVLSRPGAGGGRVRPGHVVRVLGVLVRSRLVQFLVLGGAIFALAPRPPSQRDLALDGATFAALEKAEAQRRGVPVLGPEEANEVRTRAIEDEILYREALRLGLDRNDGVVRQRLIQKVLFLAEDLAGVARPPSEAELRAFFEATRSQWKRPARVRLIHVYAAPERQEWLAGLGGAVAAAEAAAPGEPPPLGEAFPLPRTVVMTREDLEAAYGEPFAASVFELGPGAWSEPIRSKFGWHLVKVLERAEAGPADFEDVRGTLPLTYLVARKKQAAADFLRRAAARYRITVDGRPIAAPPSRGRLPPPRSEEPD